MVYKRFRFNNYKEVEEARQSNSVSPAIARELAEVNKLGENYPYRNSKR